MALETVNNGWWSIYFGIKWPEKSDPIWYMDLLLAHKILRPTIAHYRSSFQSWQFHRRAVPDKHGHEFTFSFFSSRDVMVEIYHSIKDDSILNELKSAGWITQVIYDTENISPHISGKSQPSWPSPIKASWPYYITGVCEMWLTLIDEVSNSQEIEQSSSLVEILDKYRKIHEITSEMWQQSGHHAFLHHINAIFGYVPVLIQGQYLAWF